MQIRDAQPPFDNNDLLTFEQEIGATLPTDYRNFLKRYNGGKPSLSVFKWGEGAYSDSDVRYFFSLGGAAYSDLRRIRGVYQQSDVRVPLDVLPIATDSGGNLVCIGIQGERYGRVYFWDHEEELEEEDEDGEVELAPPHDNLQLISENFEDFLKSLQKPNDHTQDPFWPWTFFCCSCRLSVW